MTPSPVLGSPRRNFNGVVAVSRVFSSRLNLACGARCGEREARSAALLRGEKQTELIDDRKRRAAKRARLSCTGWLVVRRRVGLRLPLAFLVLGVDHAGLVGSRVRVFRTLNAATLSGSILPLRRVTFELSIRIRAATLAHMAGRHSAGMVASAFRGERGRAHREDKSRCNSKKRFVVHAEMPVVIASLRIVSGRLVAKRELTTPAVR